MKPVRLLITLLLAVLLPIQGALAAVMVCPHETGVSHANDLSQPDEHLMHRMPMPGESGIEGSHHHHQHQQLDRQASKCGLCAACCSGAALASAEPTELRVALAAGETFTVPPLPATSFISDGQERPPRSF